MTPLQKARKRRRWVKYRAKQQNHLCAICGEPFDYYTGDPQEQRTCDHIIPLSKGGEDTCDNVQAVHYRCNQAKADQLFP